MQGPCKTMSDGLDDMQGDEQEREAIAFRPAFTRAAVAGLLAAAVLGILLSPLAWYRPAFALSGLLRVVIAFAVAWVLFEVVHRAGGMIGWPFSGLVAVLTVLVLLSHHVIFALHGVPTTRGVAAGSVWLTPKVLLVVNIPALVGLVGCIWVRHDGDADLNTVIDILRRGPYGP
jgi:hypothetical protein